MRLDWLDDLLALADTGSLSEAAHRRNLTQSAFSRRIQGIEAYLGVPVIDRARKPVTLRPTTRAHLDEIELSAAGLRRLITGLRRGDHAAENRVVLASQHALTTSVAPDLVRQIQSRTPETLVRLRSANLDECFAMILSRQVDLALVYQADGLLPPVQAEFTNLLEMGRDQLIPVAATAHMDQFERDMRRGQLAIVAYPRDVFFGQVLHTTLLPALSMEMAPEIRVETALTLAARELALSGVGVAWVPRALVAQPLASGALVDLSKRLGSRDLRVMALRVTGQASAVSQAVWQHLERMAGQLDPPSPPRTTP